MVDLNTTIHEIFKLLTVSITEEKAEILIDRYLRNRTLQEIANETGVTRERIRQKEAKSIGYYYDLLKIRGYKNDMDAIFKSAASKLQVIENNSLYKTVNPFIEKFNFILRISTKFPDSKYKIERNRLLINEVYLHSEMNLDELISDFKLFYKSDKNNLIKNINQKYNLNLDDKFLLNFVNLSQLEESQELLLNFEIKNFEGNRMDKIERFLLERGREATVHEISQTLNMEERSVRSALDLTEKVVNIGKSVYGHIDNGYKSGTTQELIFEYIKLNSPVSLFKIQRYIKKERVVKDISITMYLSGLKKKGLIEKIDDEYHFIKDDTLKIQEVQKMNKKPKTYQEEDVLKEILRFNINDKKEIIVGEAKDFIRIGEYIYTNKYEGPTKSGIVIKKSQKDLFLKNLNTTLNTLEETRMPWNNIANAELVIKKEERIPSSKTYYIDMRQYLSAKNFEGYTKKGLRLDEEVLIEFLERLKKESII